MAPSSQPPRRHPPRTVRRAGTALLPLLAALLGAAGAQAQTADPKELLRSAVANQLRPMLGDGAGPVVERLALVKPDGAISRNFDLARVTSALFGRNAVALAPDCRTTSTPAKEPDTGACIVESGSRERRQRALLCIELSRLERRLCIGKAGISFLFGFDHAMLSLDKGCLPVFQILVLRREVIR